MLAAVSTIGCWLTVMKPVLDLSDSLRWMPWFRNKQPAAVDYKIHPNHDSRLNRSYDRD
jgi:hypothetical protein